MVYWEEGSQIKIKYLMPVGRNRKIRHFAEYVTLTKRREFIEKGF